MSLVTNNATTTQTNFSVRTPIPPYTPNRASFLSSGVVDKDNQGSASATIGASTVLSNMVFISPTGASQVYTLPTAAALLSEFGRSIDTGIPKTVVGNTLCFNVCNRGNFGATLQSNTVGGDGTAVACGSGAVGSGTLAQCGKVTPVYLEWLAVSGGVNGATGQYTIYSQ